MSRSWAKGSTRAWRTIRARVLARDRWRCRVAIDGVCTGAATVVHHLRGKAAGDDERHLVAACAPCNARVNDPSVASTHLRVVAWIRAQPRATHVAAMARAHPDVTDANLAMILRRAVQRGELVRLGRGHYRAGPTGIPPAAVDSDPPNQAVTRW